MFRLRWQFCKFNENRWGKIWLTAWRRRRALASGRATALTTACCRASGTWPHPLLSGSAHGTPKQAPRSTPRAPTPHASPLRGPHLRITEHTQIKIGAPKRQVSNSQPPEDATADGDKITVSQHSVLFWSPPKKSLSTLKSNGFGIVSAVSALQRNSPMMGKAVASPSVSAVAAFLFSPPAALSDPFREIFFWN